MRHPNLVLRLWAELLLACCLPAPAAAQRGGGDDDDDGQYQILQARYGTATNNVDVTQRLKELARQDRSFRAGNTTFGTDPHPDQVKTLRLYTRGRDGDDRIFKYAEDSQVDGSRFTGWSAANWGRPAWGSGWGAAG